MDGNEVKSNCTRTLLHYSESTDPILAAGEAVLPLPIRTLSEVGRYGHCDCEDSMRLNSSLNNLSASATCSGGMLFLCESLAFRASSSLRSEARIHQA